MSFGGLHRVPKIKKALVRAIEYELQKPGELSRWLEFLHFQAAFKAMHWFDVEEVKQDA